MSNKRNKGGPHRSGNLPTNDQRTASAQRAAAARERIAAAQRRRRLQVVLSSVVGVIVIVAALVVVKVASDSGGPKSGTKATQGGTSLTANLAGVPSSTFDSVGVGSSTASLKAGSGTSLTSAGKPELLYVGAEWCPYCAATRWSLAVALTRFGTLTKVGEVRSSSTDVYPNTATLSFHGATFTSKYLTFVGKEIQSNQVQGGKYTNLDQLTSDETKLFEAGGGGFPYLNFAGKYLLQQAAFDPQTLAGKDQAQIAAVLADKTSPIAKAIDGGANVITAGICATTGQQPASVCSSSGVKAAAGALSSSG